MYSPAAIAAFGEFKAIFDPANLLNPGIIVAPDPIDADLRLAGANPLRSRGFAFLSDGGDLSRAVHRCTGIGKCRADNSAAGGFMCPSYLATRDEKDSTRGRARVLQEMLNGTLLTDGWKSAEIAESLDLCLSCKACGSDCPAGVDMASYKSEWLYEKYRHRPRPIAHYALGALPRWLRLGQVVPNLVNTAGRVRPGAAARHARRRHRPAAGGPGARPADVPAVVAGPTRDAARQCAGPPRHGRSCSGWTASPTPSTRRSGGPR